MIDQNAERITRSHVALIALLTIVVMFEGFDISATSVVLPYLGKEFGAEPPELGRALSLIALGSIVAWATVRLGDRFGRRPILLFSAAAFSIGSLATVLVQDVAGYVAVQLVTRIFLVTQIATAYVIVSETLPPAARGRANGLLGAFGSFGAALPYLLLAPALETPLGWRMLFVIGAVPLLTLPFLWAWLRETPVWLAARASGAPRLSALEELRQLTAPGLRRNALTMTLLWLIVNFASSVSALFFTLYVVKERGWAATDFALIAPIGLMGAFVGYAGAGWLMDRIGRRWTLTLYMGALGALTMLCYTATGWWTVAGAFLGIQAVIGVWVVAYTLNSELFPTHLRAAANGWCHNLLARWGVVIAPFVLGALTARMGAIGPAATALGAVAWAAIPVAWLLLPETRGRRLDEPAAA
ncbi:MFS transporter [Sphingomonas jatrophae]|uniref:MFS transporter, putative metabolite:H+ symporter n=1 Tax=Sphingomonas jatrophae TaxID=1166337 RepID=A0A1I6KGU1_9SPHN|nr:MFS transporter [Sphingomonas jatrophae]SFR90462.1 MFS transporter, putative metabolite:H+ symporter [Sphingomonas jatrophae]